MDVSYEIDEEKSADSSSRTALLYLNYKEDSIMMFTSMIRVCAVVGITAVTLVGSLLRAKNDNGPINQNSFNNSKPYNCNTGDDTMYNNNAYGSQSRRFYGGYAPQQPMGYGYPMPAQMPASMPQPQFQRPLSFGPSTLQPSPQLQAVLNQYGYQAPGFNNAYAASMNMYGYQQYPTYAQNMNMGYQMPATSRRNMGGYGYPQQPQQYQMNASAYGYNTPNPSNGIYRDPGYVDPAVQSLYNSNASYGYGYSQPTQQQQQYQQAQQQMAQSNMSYGYSQPMNFVNYNGIIGSAARYKCWCPSSSYGSQVYYGYDDNLPSYPPDPQEYYQQYPQPQFQQQVPPPPQQFQQPNPYAQPIPPQGYPSPVYQSMNSVNESIRRRQMMQQQKAQQEYMNYLMRQQAQQQQQMRPQPVPPPDMSGRLSNDIHPIGNVDNGSGWYTPDELNQFNPPPQPQPQPQPQQPQQMTVPEPNDSEISFDAMLNNNAAKEPIQYKSIDEAPVPTHVMTFGAPPPPENNIPDNIPVQQPHPQQMRTQQPMVPPGMTLLS